MDYKSRASFKLLEANMRQKFIRKGYTVVDLGASPGGWSQMALEIVGVDEKKPKVFAMDVLSMEYVNKVYISLLGVNSCRGT